MHDKPKRSPCFFHSDVAESVDQVRIAQDSHGYEPDTFFRAVARGLNQLAAETEKAENRNPCARAGYCIYSLGSMACSICGREKP